MSHTTKEKDDGTTSKDQADSSYIEEDDNEGPPSGGKDSLKKGPWTAAEDAILIDYVSKHGEGNWNTVQKESGLSRCGKSCRLRWANHLRPNLRKGPFTPDEEKLIVELHAKMGNKWARMAAQLPGRTDNEIKNYWNTRIKRHHRAGLPLYPSDVSLQSVDENQQEMSVNEVKFGDKQKNELLDPSIYDMADNILTRIISNQEISLATSYTPICFGNSILNQGLEPHLDFITRGHHKRLRESETLYSSTCGTFLLPDFKQFTIENPARTYQAFGSGFPYDPDPGSHAPLNGNFSTSQSLQTTVKTELPSLQYQGNDTNVWLKDFQSFPFLTEPAYVEPSQTTVPLQSECFSQCTDGLLESVFSGQAMSNARKQSSETSSISSIATLDNLIGSPVPDLFNLEWGPLDPISPFRCSVDSVSSDWLPPSAGATLSGSPPEYASSAFRPSVGSVSSEYLPLTSGSPPGKALPDCTSSLNVKTDPAGTLPIADLKAEVSQQDFYENDDMLGTYWCSNFADDNSSFLDPVEVITGKNFYGEDQDPLVEHSNNSMQY